MAEKEDASFSACLMSLRLYGLRGNKTQPEVGSAKVLSRQMQRKLMSSDVSVLFLGRVLHELCKTPRLYETPPASAGGPPFTPYSPGVHTRRDTPDPIPNSAVKPSGPMILSQDGKVGQCRALLKQALTSKTRGSLLLFLSIQPAETYLFALAGFFLTTVLSIAQYWKYFGTMSLSR